MEFWTSADLVHPYCEQQGTRGFCAYHTHPVQGNSECIIYFKGALTLTVEIKTNLIITGKIYLFITYHSKGKQLTSHVIWQRLKVKQRGGKAL